MKWISTDLLLTDEHEDEIDRQWPEWDDHLENNREDSTNTQVPKLNCSKYSAFDCEKSFISQF